MTSEQVRYFLVLEREKSFTTASEELCISVSGLSKQIHALEDEIGVPLFCRTARYVTLTQAGLEFSKHAKAMHETYLQMVRSMNSFLSLKKRTITLAAIGLLKMYNMTDMITTFLALHPDSQINIIEGSPSSSIQLLKNMEADIAFVNIYQFDESNLLVYPFMYDELVLLVCKDHRFAGEEIISLAEAQSELFLFLSNETAIYRLAHDCCTKAGFVPRKLNPQQNDMRIETIVHMISKGYGVTFLSKKAAEFYVSEDVRIVRLKEAPVLCSALISRDEKLSCSASSFIEFTCNYYRLKEIENG